MTTTFGITTRGMRVECDDQLVVIHGLWWTKRRIPTERIVAVTSYPSIIYCSQHGRIRRKRIWFLAPSRYADPSQAVRHQMLDQITRLIRSSPSRDSRQLKRLDHEELVEHQRIADAGIRWAARHRRADLRGLGEYWAKQQRLLEAELTRRAKETSTPARTTEPPRNRK